VLHSKGGLTEHEKRFANKLARNGYVAVPVDYFARGGTDNIIAAYDQLMQHPRVKKDSIGLVGFSRGATEAIQFTYLSHKFSERRIKAIVLFYIGPRVPLVSSEYFPSVLFLHGDRDVHVSVRSIDLFCALQKKNGYWCEAVIYPGVRHAFDRQTLEYEGYNSKAAKDSYKRALTFLSTHLD
jgi:dienelactone hydrolase